MGFITGIKQIAAATAPRESGYAKNLKLEDGQAVKLRIMGELDPDSSNYDSKRGLSGIFKQHQSPVDWMKKAECTMESEGRCWACEQAAETKNPKWRWKQRFYVNVIVDDGINDPYVAVWNMATYRSATYEAIKDRFLDTGSVSNVTWRLKRSGKTQNDTTYVFQIMDIDSKPYVWPELEAFDLSGIVPTVAYDDQPAFYGGAVDASIVPDEPQASSTDVDWV